MEEAPRPVFVATRGPRGRRKTSLPCRSPPLQARETDFDAGIVVFFAESVRHFPSLQKELELTDEQREQLFPKLEAMFPAGRTIAPNATGRQRTQGHQGDTASATVRARPGTRDPTGGGKRISLAGYGEILGTFPPPTRGDSSDLRRLAKGNHGTIKGIEKPPASTNQASKNCSKCHSPTVMRA